MILSDYGGVSTSQHWHRYSWYSYADPPSPNQQNPPELHSPSTEPPGRTQANFDAMLIWQNLLFLRITVSGGVGGGARDGSVSYLRGKLCWREHNVVPDRDVSSVIVCFTGGQMFRRRTAGLRPVWTQGKVSLRRSDLRLGLNHSRWTFWLYFTFSNINEMLRLKLHVQKCSFKKKTENCFTRFPLTRRTQIRSQEYLVKTKTPQTQWYDRSRFSGLSAVPLLIHRDRMIYWRFDRNF